MIRKATILTLWLISFALVGLWLQRDTVSADPKSVFCGAGGGCTADTPWYLELLPDDDIYWVKGQSDSFYPIGHYVEIHATNVWHQGENFAGGMCETDYYSNGCASPYNAVCTTHPSGCPNGTTQWYGTTYHFWDDRSQWFDAFTASSVGHDNEYCWTNLNCF